MSIQNVTSRRLSRGFTLLEVIVAFAILALSLGVIYQLFGQGLRAAGLSEKYTHATMLAQSLLAETGITFPLDAGTRSGTSVNGYEWYVITTMYGDQPVDEMVPVSYQVSVRVSWEGASQQVELTSIRLGGGR